MDRFARSLCAVLAVAGAAPAAAQQTAGQWMIGPLPADEPGAGTVHLALFRRPEMSLIGFTLPVARLDGLAEPQLASPGTPLRFGLRGDAGVLSLEGRVDAAARATGTFTFTPNAAFVDELVRAGGRRPDWVQLLSLVREEVGLPVLREAAAQGYARFSADDLLRAGRSGGLDYLRALGAVRYQAGSLAGVASLRAAGVTPAFVRELQGLGYAALPAADVAALARCGVTADFVRQANARRGARLSAAELVRLRGQAPRPAAHTRTRGCGGAGRA